MCIKNKTLILFKFAFNINLNIFIIDSTFHRDQYKNDLQTIAKNTK